MKNEIKAESSMFASMNYSRRERSLTLFFSSGRIYRYGSVEPGVFRGFLKAESKGKFFNRHIRNVYPFIEESLAS
jgi:hypothetical protein